MPKVNFTSALNRFFPELETLQVQAANIRELLSEVEEKFPGMQSYLLDDSGSLRKHVNIFIGEDLIQDEIELADPISPDDEIFIFQALSGG